MITRGEQIDLSQKSIETLKSGEGVRLYFAIPSSPFHHVSSGCPRPPRRSNAGGQYRSQS